MARKRHKPEEIAIKLRQVKILVNQGEPVPEASWHSRKHDVYEICLCAACDVDGGDRGSRAVNVVPSVCEDVTSIIPPWARTTSLVM